MKSPKNNVVLVILCFSFSLANAQYVIEPANGYTSQIGTMVDMLEEIKDQIEENTKDLDQAQTDYLFDEKANSIGALIMHLAAIEAYYQVETLEKRTFTAEEVEFWGTAAGLGSKSKEQLKGKPIKYYLDIWDQVRKKTLESLMARDDQWLASNIENIDETANNLWVWFHVLEHQANHMGQITIVKKRLPK